MDCQRCGRAWDRDTGIRVPVWELGRGTGDILAPVCEACITMDLLDAIDQAGFTMPPNYEPIRTYLLNWPAMGEAINVADWPQRH